jgi:hypothetical protein
MELDAAADLLVLCQRQMECSAEIYEYDQRGRLAILQRDLGELTVFEGPADEIFRLTLAWERPLVSAPPEGSKGAWKLPKL